MGSIVSIIKNPKAWTTLETGEKLRPEYGSEPLLNVVYGSIDDDPDGLTEIHIKIRKSLMDNILTGKYSVTTHPYTEDPLRIYDAAGNRIPPVVPGVIL